MAFDRQLFRAVLSSQCLLRTCSNFCTIVSTSLCRPLRWCSTMPRLAGKPLLPAVQLPFPHIAADSLPTEPISLSHDICPHLRQRHDTPARFDECHQSIHRRVSPHDSTVQRGQKKEAAPDALFQSLFLLARQKTKKKTDGTQNYSVLLVSSHDSCIFDGLCRVDILTALRAAVAFNLADTIPVQM